MIMKFKILINKTTFVHEKHMHSPFMSQFTDFLATIQVLLCFFYFKLTLSNCFWNVFPTMKNINICFNTFWRGASPLGFFS